MNNDAALLYKNRLNALRKEIKAAALDGFFVPMADAYLNEYVPPSERRIEFLSGFTGSAAFIIVLADSALFFTDSRYTLQAQDEVPTSLFIQFDTAKMDPTKWLLHNVSKTTLIGFDPRFHSTYQIESMRKKLESSPVSLRVLNKNPVDEIWTSRPAPLTAPIVAHDQRYTGQNSTDKRKELAKKLCTGKNDATLITDPASIAWLFNIRGGDVPDTPLPLSRAILYKDGTASWFVDPAKPTKDLSAFLGPEITVFNETDFTDSLQELGEKKSSVLLDPRHTPYIYTDCLLQAGGNVTRGDDLCALPRACKNKTEIEAMQNAHRRDGAALVKLLAWLDDQLQHNQPLTELDVVSQLETFRAQGSLHKGPSFPTIAASGPNGAIVHYRPTEQSNRPIDRDSFLLLDSGAQYLDGTTDVTRTIPTGKLTSEMKDRYTRVLKGHIALTSIRFPADTSGADLDVLARQYLWQIGEDYGHGTGHGVGAYLSVHEGPQAISRHAPTALREGMVLSNEPGFYKAGRYGIRHENLQYVTALPEISGDEQKMFGFMPLTLVPFDRRGLIIEMLETAEKEWLNAYHARVVKALMPQLDGLAKTWLEEMTKEI
ncbi:MAG: aminopeptidase P family protein [Bdellovibrionales bacterium]